MILDAATNKKRSKREKRVFIAKLCGIFAAQTLVLAAVQSVIDAMRDDDDESYGEKYLDEFLGNLVAELNPLSKLPIIRDVVSIFDGFSVVRPDTTVISKIAIACRDIDKLINGKDVPPYKLIYDILNAASMATGIGASNALRDIVAIWNTFVGEFFPHLKLKK